MFPDTTCEACGSLLVPPHMASEFRAPEGTNYVCLRCGRPYRWTGNPPRLVTILRSAPIDDELPDED